MNHAAQNIECVSVNILFGVEQIVGNVCQAFVDVKEAQQRFRWDLATELAQYAAKITENIVSFAFLFISTA